MSIRDRISNQAIREKTGRTWREWFDAIAAAEGGETKGARFEVGAQKTVALPAQQAWDCLTSLEGVTIWPGDMARPTEKRAHWKAVHASLESQCSS